MMMTIAANLLLGCSLVVAVLVIVDAIMRGLRAWRTLADYTAVKRPRESKVPQTSTGEWLWGQGGFTPQPRLLQISVQRA